MTIIHASQDYLYHVTVRDVPSIGAKHLKIESQWLGAKKPKQRQVRFAVTLPAADLNLIAKAILDQTQPKGN